MWNWLDQYDIQNYLYVRSRIYYDYNMQKLRINIFIELIVK
jgi:hypothetical protein